MNKVKQPLKKGNTSWKPASLNEFSNKEDGFRYRMSRKDSDNLSKKQQEGWETVSDLQSPDTKHENPNRIDLGTPLTSVQEGRDWVLQRIPEDVAQARDQYQEDLKERKTQALTAHIKKEANEQGTDTHGEITISSRKGTKTFN